MPINDVSRQEDLVSVIIPVFNAKPYLDRCVQSVIGQNYQNLEIILMDDASTDGSLALCRAWEKKDSRIKVYHHDVNMGQGPVRDEGVRVSSGNYFVFIDADDTVEPDFVKELHQAIRDQDAELAICDISFVWEGETGKEFRNRREPVVLREFYQKKAGDLSDWKDMTFSLCNKIYRRDFWDRCKIRQLGKGFAEDVVASLILIYHATRIAQVRRVLYRYYQNPNSTVHFKGYSEVLENTLNALKGWYAALDLDPCHQYIVKRLSAGMIGLNEWSDRREKDGEEGALSGCFQRLFHPQKDMAWKDCVALGSYSLRTAVRAYRYVMPESYSFSSMISLMSKPIEYDSVSHPNRFRQQALEAELSKKVLERLVKQNVNLLFLDFLEERYGVLQMENGGFITNSDALKEAKFSCAQKPVKAIEPCTPEYFSLWKRACKNLVGHLKQLDVTVVLIQNRLASEYGNWDSEKTPFENQEWLKQVNDQCERMEKCFAKLFPQTVCILADKMYFYTDEAYPYGCHPWHMNCYWYYEMGVKLYHQLGT